MAPRTTNGDVAERLARMEEKIDTLVGVVGKTPAEGLRADVALLIGIKNKGWGLIVGILIFAGAVGASIKTALGDIFK